MFRNLLAFVFGAILLAAGIAFSAVAFVLLAALGLVAWAWLWWKTRKLRGKAQAEFPSQDGRVIEGESIVVEEFHVTTEHVLPEDASRR